MSDGTDKPNDAVQRGGECDCSTAEEFWGKLDPLHPFWQPDPSVWVFRGQDSDYSLAPKLNRRKPPFALTPKLPGSELPESPFWSSTMSVSDGRQERMVRRFRKHLDRVGLPIPGQSPDTLAKGRIPVRAQLDWEEFPLLALAQHHRLPTQLLDWTVRARVAAYFAAADAAKMRERKGQLTVWALRADFAQELEWHDCFLTIETAPRASNPNLHAQSGIFTWLTGKDAHLFALEDFIAQAAAHPQETERPDHAPQVPFPLMRCLTLPQSEAPTLLRLLSYEGIDAASMFPGYDGVVKVMREETLWDTPPADAHREPKRISKKDDDDETR